MALINLYGTPDPSKPYNYEDDSWLNRHLGEPVDFDCAGAVREKTWRWHRSKLSYGIRIMFPKLSAIISRSGIM